MKKILLLIGISFFISIEGYYYFVDQFFPKEASKIDMDNYIFRETLKELMARYSESSSHEDLMWFNDRIDFLIKRTSKEDIVNGLKEEIEKTSDVELKKLLKTMKNQFEKTKKISLSSKIKEAISKVKDYFVSKFIKGKNKLKKSYDEISTQEWVNVYSEALDAISNLPKLHNHKTGQLARDIYLKGYLERLDFLPLNRLEPIMKEIGGKLLNILTDNPSTIISHGLRGSWKTFKKIKKYLNIEDPDKFMKDFLKNYLNDSSGDPPITNERDWDGMKKMMQELDVSSKTRSKVANDFFVKSFQNLEQYLINFRDGGIYELSSAINNLASLTEAERKTVLSKIGKELVVLIKKYPKSILEHSDSKTISSNFKKIQPDLGLSNNHVREIVTGKKITQNNISQSRPAENNDNEQGTGEDNSINNTRNTNDF